MPYLHEGLGDAADSIAHQTSTIQPSTRPKSVSNHTNDHSVIPGMRQLHHQTRGGAHYMPAQYNPGKIRPNQGPGANHRHIYLGRSL